METLASGWACDPCNLSDLREEPPPVWESQSAFNASSPPPALMWTNQLSPHLHRNKLLQDTLLQREEELARLQEENNKLRQFFNSSFVRNLQEKAKKLTANGGRKLKRSLINDDNGPLQPRGHQLLNSQNISKRVCRNLTAEFCSESFETSSSSEPNLDLWVLRTLGLKDQDTIDTSSDITSSSGYSTLVQNTECSLNSSFDSPDASSSTPSSFHNYCQTPVTDYRYSTAKNQDGQCLSPASFSHSCTSPPGQRFDFTATGTFESPETVIRTYDTFTALQSPSQDFTTSSHQADCSQITASGTVQTVQGNPAEPPNYWSPFRSSKAPSQEPIHFSPPTEGVHFSPLASSSPVQLRMPVHGSSPTSPSEGSATPQTPRSRTDLAFSMCLSPSSSVKTHSFPQGQAFVRKDTGGRWNFTWVPRQGP
ncbi:geminin coiled-coil domain-containing protein 1 [Cheilinus undulatus]|uniref:geminin coiled-coil domain-containing protein 1 n=1 Tax=Cheilinus undulatus TaxID=241271 RepID=UPI001BD289B3|nr:geminin coiled-coil domain-containing protein 1 [Cheilinus undulatus]